MLSKMINMMSQVLSWYKSSWPHWITPAVTLWRVVQKTLSVDTWKGSAVSVSELPVALYVNCPWYELSTASSTLSWAVGDFMQAKQPHCCRTQLQMMPSISFLSTQLKLGLWIWTTTKQNLASTYLNIKTSFLQLHFSLFLICHFCS